MSSPTSLNKDLSKVAPKDVPHGKHPDGILLKNLVPLSPLGPSESRTFGMSSLGMGYVCQKSDPAVRLTFSPVVSLERISSGFQDIGNQLNKNVWEVTRLDLILAHLPGFILSSLYPENNPLSSLCACRLPDWGPRGCSSLSGCNLASASVWDFGDGSR
ncbi:unnamed protein product [Kuraishia capsulata CBS 1993]|uniref:Uncharacterized protein n=1 Tax=Kuraishia capsulata CBS 1993 TaxID=1382522 RepID=W6MHG2_9ASCO|nr:uncharacterized protein KUCA_T00001386001 [Kuraishia capsulata CBS 1993]CDK25416.1 unnamed protein product [Kuraishia capsulata CBS 1993]